MLDFMTVATRSVKRGVVEIYPEFQICKSRDLMIRGRDFYAIWDEDRKLWSTDEQDAVRLIDREVAEYAKSFRAMEGETIRVLYMRKAQSGMIDIWHRYCQKQLRDGYHMLDEKLIFSNMDTDRKDYASKKLSYPLEKGECPAWERLMSVLYSPEERMKIEWAIGSIVHGDSKKIQKFLVLYGAAGTGKSTILNVVQMLFDGYYSTFDAKALGSSSNVFALESFRTNPLVAIQHDGDLSHIEDNTRLNSLVSHELMEVNEKFKSTYQNRFKAFLFMGTNKPVRITDAKSGLIRRLIDVSPSGEKLSPSEYKTVMEQVKYELGAIAQHCLEVYKKHTDAYDNYIPTAMLGASNDFYNFVVDNCFTLSKEEGVSLKSAWEIYKQYVEEAKVPYPMSQRIFKEELKNYFREYEDRHLGADGVRIRSWYGGFRSDRFENDISRSEKKPEGETPETWLKFKECDSLLDILIADQAAQYSSPDEKPSLVWDNVKTKLSDLDTHDLHYVRLPLNHIVIDFDIPDENGQKCLEKNMEAASKFPPTYAELSKSGKGIHLHYIYAGDPEKLSRIYDEHIEIKVFTGKSSLRRKLSLCTDIPISTISSGLPLKGEKMIDPNIVTTERGIRTLIMRNLNKEYHAGTKPSIDFIFKILEDAYTGGVHYDVTDMRNAVLAFAAHSTHQADYCIALVGKMHFKSEDPAEPIPEDEERLIFFDVEVFPNLFVVCWKYHGDGQDQVVRLINPKPAAMEDLIKRRLIGFNCRDYDNHIVWARLMDYSNEALFHLSQKIIQDGKGKFGEAYNLSYTDIYDFAATKQSLKKWEIELGIHHSELGLPWDQPVPEELWDKVAEYCCNDVNATEAVFDHLKGDWTSRQILAKISGLSVNDKTNAHTAKIIFGADKHPKLNTPDLSLTFPGYSYENGHNMYRGEDVGRGGYVYTQPGTYIGRTITFDVASMHPSSIIAMNLFGEYTERFKDILDLRIAIKHKDFDRARSMMGGAFAEYLTDESTAKALAAALKIAINSVYGMTSASFENIFRAPENVNNVVALRGALFMVTLRDEVQKRGGTVIHIKTDSIKIFEPTDEIYNFVMDFGKQYGYNFEIEHIFERICLVNKAVYIAKLAEDDPDDPGKWTATGDQFAVPYVFKSLFTHEDICFDDLCDTKSVSSAIYMDENEKLPEGEHRYRFIGKVGRFTPVLAGGDGGYLLRDTGKTDENGNKKFAAVEGTKGYRWIESEVVRELNWKDMIDISYFKTLADKAIETIGKYGDFEQFVRGAEDTPPWDASAMDDDFVPFDVR